MYERLKCCNSTNKELKWFELYLAVRHTKNQNNDTKKDTGTGLIYRAFDPTNKLQKQQTAAINNTINNQ